MSRRTGIVLAIAAVILAVVAYLWMRSRRDAVASSGAASTVPTEAGEDERGETERLVAAGGAGLAGFAAALAGAAS